MCGIAGMVSDRQGGLSAGDAAGVVKQMCDRIVHRGPDDFGVHADGTAAIGMRRLSIIDLSTGHQPIHNEDQTIWLVFNGEIYNYQELRQELEALGHRFYTHSDSEVIVHAFEQYDVQCFARLRGMFAIALWDSRQQRFVLARDRFGKKPLFWTRLRDGRLAFGSELKTLLVLPELSRAISTDAVHLYLALGYVPTPHSIFTDVHKLEPAHWLEFRGGQVRTERYWSLDFTQKLRGSPAELAEQLHSQLDDAVHARLVSDVPFGAFLSGGLDSSVVVALMAGHLSEPVRTFTIGFEDAQFDERDDARRVARHFGTRHEELVVQPNAAELVPKLVWHLDEPFGDSSSIPTYLVSQMAARHVKMVLSGDGGDEMFGGYTRYRKYLQLRRWRAQSLGLAGPAGGLLGAVLPGRLGRRVGKVSQRLRAGYPFDYLSGVGLMSPDAARELLLKAPGPAAERYGIARKPFEGTDNLGMLDRIIAGDIRTYMLDDILVKVDRMTMAASLEARSPLLDHRLAEFAASLPPEMKMRDGVGKRLLRDVADKILPPECLQKRKQGFAIPLAQWLRGPLQPMLLDAIGGRRFLERGIFDQAKVMGLARQHFAGEVDNAEPLWLVLNFELWARNFVDGQA